MYMLGVFGIIVAVLMIGLVLTMISSGGLKLVPLMIGSLLSISFLAALWLYLRGHRKTVKHFTDIGLSRNDGRDFAWSGLSRVVDKMAIKPGSQDRLLWRTEIQFNDGSSAWLIPSKVSNFDEVYAYIGGLQCEHVQEDA
jgi:hypothetical protein